MKKNATLNVRVEPRMLEALKAESLRTGNPQAEIVREAITARLAPHQRQTPEEN